ncbi:MAG: hypothetical protein HYX69_08505 [Planctomycetia bacterium]|nr:hypothetical protein [Planctomycetia bacterium]
MDDHGEVGRIAEVTTNLVRTHAELMSRVEPFLEAIRTFLLALPGPADIVHD